MNGILKFGILFVLLAVVLSVFGTSIVTIFDSFGGGLNYVTSGNIGIVLSSIVGYIGWFLDFLFLGSATTYTTYYGGIQVASLSWVITFVRVIFGLSVMTLILGLIFRR